VSTSPWSGAPRGATLTAPWSGRADRPVASQPAPAATGSGSPSGTQTGSDEPPGASRLIEILTVVLLAVATVGSAWSAYQVARWNGIETDEARSSGSLRIDASREYSLATQIVAYDAAAVGQFGQAVAAGNDDLEEFLRATIIRPGFESILQQWRDEIDAGMVPTNLLENDDYLRELFAASDELDAASLAATQRSEEAGDNADGYVRLTLFFATSLFFAGITASFSSRTARIMLLSAAGVTVAIAIGLLVSYPVA
jgi:hypothetical protein